jgi:hypothetical protein
MLLDGANWLSVWTYWWVYRLIHNVRRDANYPVELVEQQKVSSATTVLKKHWDEEVKKAELQKR